MGMGQNFGTLETQMDDGWVIFRKPGCILNYFEYPSVSREGPTSSFRAVSKRYLISERRHKHGTHPSILTSSPELRLHMSVVFLLSTMVSITDVPNQSAAAAQPISAGLRRAKGTRGGGYFWEAKRDSYVSGCCKSLESLSWLISFTNANNCWIYGRYIELICVYTPTSVRGFTLVMSHCSLASESLAPHGLLHVI